MFNILLGLICAAAICFLLRFLVALQAELRRPARSKLPVSVSPLDPKVFSEMNNNQMSKAAVAEFRREATRPAGERNMRIVVSVILSLTISILCALPSFAQETGTQSNAASAEEVRDLRVLVQELQAKVARLENSTQPQADSELASFASRDLRTKVELSCWWRR